MDNREYFRMFDLEETYWWHTGLHSLLCRTMKGLVSVDARILDAGCGTGGAMLAVHRALPELRLVGVDASEVAAGFVRKRNSGVAMVGSVNELPFSDETFDGVISMDVLYASEVDDVSAVSQFHRVLKPGGHLLLNVAALEWLRGGHDIAHRTARRYSKKDLRNLLESAQFQVISMQYWNFILFPLVFAWRLFGRIFGRYYVPDSDLRPLPPALNKCLQWMIHQELIMMKRISYPVGSSIFAVAAKPGSLRQ